MTTPDFLKLLREARDQFDWELVADVSYPAERRSTPRLHIRARLRGESHTGFSLDPLRAVCYVKNGKLYESSAWSDVAEDLGVNVAQAAALLAASHDRTWSGSGKERAPADHIVSLRERLLEATGLDAAFSARRSPDQTS